MYVCMYVYIYIYVYTYIHTVTEVTDDCPVKPGAWSRQAGGGSRGALSCSNSFSY